MFMDGVGGYGLFMDGAGSHGGGDMASCIPVHLAGCFEIIEQNVLPFSVEQENTNPARRSNSVRGYTCSRIVFSGRA